MDRAMKQSTHQFQKIFFHIKMFGIQCRKKSLQLKIKKEN